MKVRKGNNNAKPSLVIGIPPRVASSMSLSLRDDVEWNQNNKGRWELIKIEV